MIWLIVWWSGWLCGDLVGYVVIWLVVWWSGWLYDDLVGYVMIWLVVWWSGWLCDDLVGYVVIWLVVWCSGWLCDDLVGCVMIWLVMWWSGWLCDDLVGYVMIWLVVWCSGWLSGWLCDNLVGYVMIYPVMWWSSRVCDEMTGISDGDALILMFSSSLFLLLYTSWTNTQTVDLNHIFAQVWRHRRMHQWHGLEPAWTLILHQTSVLSKWQNQSLRLDVRAGHRDRQPTQVVWISDILPNASEGRRKLSSNPSNVWTTYEVVLIKELAKSDLFSSLATSVSYSCVITRNIPSTLPSWPRCRHLAVSITGRWSSTRRDLVSASCCYVTEITQRRSAGEH